MADDTPRAPDLIVRGIWNRRTLVRTPAVLSGGLTAWHVRQFVQALDDAAIPDDAAISDRHANDTRHLIGLEAHLDEVRDDR